MKILSRVGSSVIIEAKDGSIWLTMRKKRGHDNRRRVPHVTKKPSVIYIPIKKLSKVEIFPKYDIHRCGDGHWPGLPFTL